MSELARLKVGPEEPDNEAFGELMRQVRDAHRYSRTRAAQLLDLSSEYLRLIERGQRTSAAMTTVDMLEAYGEPFEVEREGDNAVIIFRDHRVQFASRIQESRGAKGRPQAPTAVTRNEQLGYIVSILTIADDETINAVYRKLKES